MAHLDAKTWDRRTERCQELIFRAAGVQARLHKVDVPAAVRALVGRHALHGRTQEWREFGDVALFLVASYPPDLAYVILYGTRELKPPLGYDLVPFVLKAIENLHHVRAEALDLQADTAELEELVRDPEARGRRAAKMLAREVSCTPLRHATGILQYMDAQARGYLEDALREFNPEGARLLGSGVARPRKPGWIRRGLLRILFGRDS